jgi:UDP-N-acetylglucosamine--N-acetylmuramyl-(pentapeptide) pyrophosphoryl-undecaprenol N-acetylglucosamine transferase
LEIIAYMTVLFTGGGTLGPVTPLLAVLRQMKKRRTDIDFAWAGTTNGTEREVVEREGMKFYAIPEAKISRYPTVKWLTWPFDYLRARFVSHRVIQQVKPSLVVSVGGFTSVPVIIAARRKNIPCAIHQLDAEPGLANKAVAKLCKSVTTSFSYDIPPFHGVKSEQTVTPCRFASVKVPTKEDAARYFRLDPSRNVVFIVGGGTGAMSINEAVWKVIGRLLMTAQVIHLTGKGKARYADVGHPILGGRRTSDDLGGERSGYVMKEFFDESLMLNAYAAADIVVSRAGMGGITDLISLKKPAILIPIPKSHQERNVRRLPFAVVQQGSHFEERLFKEIEQFLHDKEALRNLGEVVGSALPVDDGSALAERWMGLL